MQHEQLDYPDLAFVDIETTGSNFDRDRITEIGIKLLSGDHQETWESLINPGTFIPQNIQALTGIRPEMVQDQPPFDELARKILEKFFLGHYHRGQTMWTQVQSNTDISSSNNFDLMEKMQKICKTMTVLLKQILQNNGLNCENIEDRVTLRLIDYINIEKKINNTLRTHIESSVITIILDHDSPNLIVNSFTNNSFS
jgi:DNA polymerase III alpha subunit (gram-positive type)